VVEKEVCVICKKPEDLKPHTMGWNEVSIHERCEQYYLGKMDHFYKNRMVQLKDEKQVFPKFAHLRCRKCGKEWLEPPGPTQCPTCFHLYLDWLNYTPQRYYWVPKRSLKKDEDGNDRV